MHGPSGVPRNNQRGFFKVHHSPNYERIALQHGFILSRLWQHVDLYHIIDRKVSSLHSSIAEQPEPGPCLGIIH